MKIGLDLAEIIRTRNLGRYAPKFLAPAEGWWPSATKWGPFGPPNGGPSGPQMGTLWAPWTNTNTYIAQIQIQIHIEHKYKYIYGEEQIQQLRTKSLRSSRSRSRSSTKHI